MTQFSSIAVTHLSRLHGTRLSRKSEWLNRHWWVWATVKSVKHTCNQFSHSIYLFNLVLDTKWDLHLLNKNMTKQKGISCTKVSNSAWTDQIDGKGLVEGGGCKSLTAKCSSCTGTLHIKVDRTVDPVGTPDPFSTHLISWLNDPTYAWLGRIVYEVKSDVWNE